MGHRQGQQKKAADRPRKGQRQRQEQSCSSMAVRDCRYQNAYYVQVKSYKLTHHL